MADELKYKTARNWKCNPKYNDHEDCPGIWSIFGTGKSGPCSCPCHRPKPEETMRAADNSKTIPKPRL